jgi:hypothetical protein
MASEIPETSPDYEQTRIIERPDGFYWQHKESGEEFGPFATLLEAVKDMEFADANSEPVEPLEEAESEIGIEGWIDPETGEPAEEHVPRIKDE